MIEFFSTELARGVAVGFSVGFLAGGAICTFIVGLMGFYTMVRMAKAHSKEKAALQAKIDALMMEHCPDEMTVLQKWDWERHQKVAS